MLTAEYRRDFVPPDWFPKGRWNRRVYCGRRVYVNGNCMRLTIEQEKELDVAGRCRVEEQREGCMLPLEWNVILFPKVDSAMSSATIILDDPMKRQLIRFQLFKSGTPDKWLYYYKCGSCSKYCTPTFTSETGIHGVIPADVRHDMSAHAVKCKPEGEPTL